MSSVAVLGSGVVGQTLARGFAELGHTVVVGSRTGKPVAGWDGPTATFAEAALGAESVVLAVKGTIAEELVTSLAAQLQGKTVMDTTNPIADRPPTDGVLAYFTTFEESLMERLQRAAPEAHFVKAFNSVGNARMVQPWFADGTRPTMFIAGNHDAAKAESIAFLDGLGWEVADMGTAAAARAIEPLCMLWCIPGLRGGSWTHAFKLLQD
ncbi:NADPH-dependent F420 reductase [Pedococcus sp. 5OH_020]|uniref:NADPH-dependent F420 reductase n=1 Tax=Pedococcus sp. 5OH_020 TaxID=2989814 RepID=UPI0022EA05CE|nr:NAD(P)-binding domain-containing protein [Pedococcus sp. 5OH_020]